MCLVHINNSIGIVKIYKTRISEECCKNMEFRV
jgi:hypothetical protein